MNVPDISILDTIDDLQEKLAVKAFITTTLSAPQIEEKLHIGIKKIYRIAEKYFPRGFVKDRQLEINNGKFIAAVIQDELPAPQAQASDPVTVIDLPAPSAESIKDSSQNSGDKKPAISPVQEQNFQSIEKRRVTFEIVKEACNQLIEQDKTPSVQNIRQILKGGSFTYISKYQRQYLSEIGYQFQTQGNKASCFVTEGINLNVEKGDLKFNLNICKCTQDAAVSIVQLVSQMVSNK